MPLYSQMLNLFQNTPTAEQQAQFKKFNASFPLEFGYIHFYNSILDDLGNGR